MAMDGGATLTTMATTDTTPLGIATGTILGTTVAPATTGASDALGVAIMPDGADTMAVTTTGTMEAMPIAIGMATAMVDPIVVGIDTTIHLALAMVEAQEATTIEHRTMLSTDVPSAIQVVP